MNYVFLIGRLTKDPTEHALSDGTPVATFTIAVDRPGKDKKADFPRIVTFAALAENCKKYLSKGKMVSVVGRIQTSSADLKSGGKQYYTDVIAREVKFLSPKDKSTEDDYVLPEGFEETNSDDDEIPF